MSRKGGQERNKTVVEHDRLEIARLYLQGSTQMEIGQKLGMHQTMVSKELSVMRERWQNASVINFAERQAAELEKIDALEIEYWQGYERSKKKRVIVTVNRQKLPVYRQVDRTKFVLN